MITRFAPSPTGYLHLGHVFAAAKAFSFAQQQGGTCLLRVEDIDHTRCRSAYTDALYEDLTWLGFNWPQPARVQSVHMKEYQASLEILRARGLIYPCFKNRREIAAGLDEDGVYRGPKTFISDDEAAARRSKGELCAWRLSMSAAREQLGAQFDQLGYDDIGAVNPGRHSARLSLYGDEILARKDIGLSYYLACTHDDALQNITHVVRGADFIALTGFQVLLQTLMGWPVPIYAHHNLLASADGKKLSKRDGASAIRVLRDNGQTPRTVLDIAMASNSV